MHPLQFVGRCSQGLILNRFVVILVLKPHPLLGTNITQLRALNLRVIYNFDIVEVGDRPGAMGNK